MKIILTLFLLNIKTSDHHTVINIGENPEANAASRSDDPKTFAISCNFMDLYKAFCFEKNSNGEILKDPIENEENNLNCLKTNVNRVNNFCINFLFAIQFLLNLCKTVLKIILTLFLLNINTSDHHTITNIGENPEAAAASRSDNIKTSNNHAIFNINEYVLHITPVNPVSRKSLNGFKITRKTEKSYTIYVDISISNKNEGICEYIIQALNKDLKLILLEFYSLNGKTFIDILQILKIKFQDRIKIRLNDKIAFNNHGISKNQKNIKDYVRDNKNNLEVFPESTRGRVFVTLIPKKMHDKAIEEERLEKERFKKKVEEEINNLNSDMYLGRKP